MKPVLLLFAPIALGICGAGAQPFTVVPHTIAGGGVTSGGRFQITGTIGQPEAGPRLTGACSSIDPGFWGPDAAVPTPGAPVLHVRPLDFNYVRVSFTPGCGEWVLQWTRSVDADPAATVWTDDPAGNLVVSDGELVRDFHVPSWGQRLFYRLRRR